MSHVRGSVAAESGHGAAAWKIKRLKIFGRLNNGVSVAEIKAALLHATAVVASRPASTPSAPPTKSWSQGALAKPT
jgi:hypothetical protein